MTVKEAIRPSQLIYQSGPGAVVDLMEKSVMIKAADQWNTWNAPKEDDVRITSILGVDHVRVINENPERQKIKAVDFPKWKICPSCHRMTTYDNQQCYFCKKKEEEKELYASRFILVCEKGHISDFPYNEWVHRNHSCTESTKEPQLKLITRGNSGSLSDLHVVCLHCKHSESLGSIMKPDEQKHSLFVCKGERPWIAPNANEKCGLKMKTTLRGASNVYAPSVISFLQVPLTSSSSDQDILYIVQKDEEQFRKLYVALGDAGLETACELKSISPSFIPVIKRYLDGELSIEESTTYESIRKQEWNTLIQTNIDEQNFTSLKVDMHPDLQPYFDAIYRIDCVPEVQVLQGFTRLNYIDRLSDDNDELQPVVNKREKWLPAVRNYGEGIFIKFNLAKLKEWEEKEQITKETFQAYNNYRDEFENSLMHFEPRQILIHTFSHALLRELAAHCGYTTTSLKERIYAMDGMYGLFIYTASGDSEGSLGGLTKLAQSDKLYPIILRALENMSYCSSDPICSDGDFEYHTTANGAACHACTFVAETSCEWGNMLLDRRTLININPNEGYGYFDELLNV
ncbi:MULTISPECIES: DUF1998 domain-containing protein [Bacillus]|uniref:DUF1998 domain-containing protein n=1 Tax=Bacillus TaxID=1386 RepID=UPI000BF5CFD7|nr:MULTISPECIES: DUF1998 domain-containing protein [Bacillus]MED4373979.1 DUF1998 domain-containing protein [Bacillus licheniformis]MED4549327.1 DUF1998 domain-containing protein [Bacillus licheniformis]